MNRKFQFLALLLGTLMALIHGPALAERPPSWMVGTFENDARRDERAITLQVDPDGRMHATAVGGDLSSLTTLSANYRGDVFNLGGQEYTVRRSGDGFRATPDTRRRPLENNRIVPILFHRVGDNRGGRLPDSGYISEHRLPSWMVGTFEGSPRNDGSVISLQVDNNGAMSASGRSGSRRNGSMTVRYRGDLLTIDGFDYRVQQSRNGFTAVATDRRNGQIDFRRVGDSVIDRGSQGNSRVPDWMIGRFEGRYGRNGRDLGLRITSEGRYTATESVNGRSPNRLPVSYRRNILTIDDRDYRVERTKDGFRASLENGQNDRNRDRTDRASDLYDQINFRRVGSE